MFTGVRAIASAAAMVSVSCAAVAQVIPPSELPGLVDPVGALLAADPRVARTTPPRR